MDLICFSHLRWNFVYQRPQHLMKRFANHFRVFYIEEPVFGSENFFLENTLSKEKVWIIVPHLLPGMDELQVHNSVNELLQEFFKMFNIKEYLFWYYTPMALETTRSFQPLGVVYDCMDELSAFRNAPPKLKECESELMSNADLVFTGGYSLYEAKKDYHPHVMAFPSSIDKNHFLQARSGKTDPADQAGIRHPRIGFFGVIDERMDIELLRTIADGRPDWNYIIIGPVVKIDPALLPVAHNIYYLGSKQYDDLPAYLGGWDIAMMPFAVNESTRFISPTKTPEYLAGGKPVVSAPIKDVVFPYGEKGLVYIATGPEEFIRGIEVQLGMKDRAAWLKAVDAFIAGDSWDRTAERMIFQVNAKLEAKQKTKIVQKEDEYV